ncbi:hypothetical protein CTA1_3461 [Colletotrichum tanaceti]|uniref:Uncharacterized protein n=1 Tax=Colletotrichum tanaceti TaxID=1306861 RepID=A0A4U6X0H9_9PEZI|nr:hypothetical protein CTA1_3461 [Colletotrichum tanaceti]
MEVPTVPTPTWNATRAAGPGPYSLGSEGRLIGHSRFVPRPPLLPVPIVRRFSVTGQHYRCFSAESLSRAKLVCVAL